MALHLAHLLILVAACGADARWLFASFTPSTPTTVDTLQTQITALQASLVAVSTSLFASTCTANTLFYAASGLPVGVAPVASLQALVNQYNTGALAVTLCKGTLVKVINAVAVSTSSTLAIGCSVISTPPLCKFDGGKQSEIINITAGNVTLTGLTFQAWEGCGEGGGGLTTVLMILPLCFPERPVPVRWGDFCRHELQSPGRAVLFPQRLGDIWRCGPRYWLVRRHIRHF